MAQSTVGTHCLVSSDGLVRSSPRVILVELLQRFGQCHQEPRLLRWRPELQVALGDGVRIALLDSGIEWFDTIFAEADIQAQDFTASGTLADATGHGTQMAALLVGQDGLVPKAKLLFGKILKPNSSGKAEGYLTQGIRWAVRQNADIIALPLGRRRPSRKVQAAIQLALSQDIQVFAAAGNRDPHRILFPASLNGVVSVTGADLLGMVLPGCAETDAVDCIALGEVPAMLFAGGAEPFSDDSAAMPCLVGSSPATVIAAAVAALKLSAGARAPLS